jgi:hypothetical protein
MTKKETPKKKKHYVFPHILFRIKRNHFLRVGVGGFEPPKTSKGHTWYTMCRFVHTSIIHYL